MSKEFLPFLTVRDNAIKLAAQIVEDGFIPDVIYVSLRGGAYMGNVISEYFKFVRKGQRPILYAAVVARSYTDIHQHGNIMVDGWTYDPKYLRAGDRILLVDDIFDSGRTINHLADIIIGQGIPRQDIKIVVHDYKVFQYAERPIDNIPDYFCRRHMIKKPDEDIWIHYLSHELVGLTGEELQTHYYAHDPELKEAFKAQCIVTNNPIIGEPMKLPEYITIKEVENVCQAIGLSDWSKKTEAVVSEAEAAIILKLVNTQKMDIPIEEFRKGLEVELEHGTRFDDANVTNNHPLLTGKIVLAHLKETMDYYLRIDVAELEGDLVKAIKARNIEKIESKYKKLVEAQRALHQAVGQQWS